jgi:lipopolysaccharide export system protein LptA
MIRRLCFVLPCLLVVLQPPAMAAEAPAPDTVIVSQSCEITSTDTQTISVFTGNVIVTGNGIRLTCDRLDVVSLRSGGKQETLGKQDRFKSLVASGNVRILQGEREATCGHAEVLPGEDRITLTGRPTVIDHGNNSTATGEPLILYRGERRITGSNVRITLPPLKDLGFDRRQPPPVSTEEPRKLP